MKHSRLEVCIDAVLHRGLADWVHDAEVAWCAMYAGGAREPEDVESLALEAIAALIHGGLVTIGDVLVDTGFRAWELDPADAVERVQREWRALGRRPTTGEIFWLENTAAGSERAHEAPVTDPPPLFPPAVVPIARALPPRKPN